MVHVQHLLAVLQVISVVVLVGPHYGVALGALQLLAHVVLARRDRTLCVRRWRARRDKKLASGGRRSAWRRAARAARAPAARRAAEKVHSGGRRGSSSAVAGRVVVHVVLIPLAWSGNRRG